MRFRSAHQQTIGPDADGISLRAARLVKWNVHPGAGQALRGLRVARESERFRVVQPRSLAARNLGEDGVVADHADSSMDVYTRALEPLRHVVAARRDAALGSTSEPGGHETATG
jgi:hypothetical protein